MAAGVAVVPMLGNAGLAVAAGEATGDGEAVTAGLGTAPGEVGEGDAGDAGEVPAGQRLQVAAQYPPAGAPVVNMKASPHFP